MKKHTKDKWNIFFTLTIIIIAIIVIVYGLILRNPIFTAIGMSPLISMGYELIKIIIKQLGK